MICIFDEIFKLSDYRPQGPSARMRMTSQGFVVLKWPTVALVEVALAEGMGSPRSGFPPSISLMYNFPSFFLSFSL
jgi:hypothetical protein